MNVGALPAERIERLKAPVDWRALQDEPRVTKEEKIRRARELRAQGVAAVLFTSDEVRQRISDLASLEHYYRNGEINDTVYACILKGGVQFTTPFVTEMSQQESTMNPVVDYIQATRYGLSQKGGRLDIVRKLDPKTDIANKTVIFTDDVTDEGITLEELSRMSKDSSLCMQLGEGVTGPARRSGAIVLGDKQLANYDGLDGDLLLQGFWLPDAWAGGMGLDGPNEAMRWLPEIVLTTTQHEKYRETLPYVLSILGDRAIIGFDDFTWTSN